ncbi:hypothetical protein ACHAXH_009925 [Discostella pseudostelligera]
MNTSSTPSMDLTMLTPFGSHSYHSSIGDNDGGINRMRGVENQCSRELRYDQLYNMIAQEEVPEYGCCDYLSYYSPQAEKPKIQKSIDVACRTSICGWMYRVADHFMIDREVVSIALSYIDRVLSTNYCADRRTFKLISAASFHLAIKVHFPHMMREVGSLIPELSRGDFSHHDVIIMEKELTHSLTWLINPTTAQCILMQILSLLHPNTPTSSRKKIARSALFFSELAVCDYYFATSRKSIVAIAAFLNASESAACVPHESSDCEYDIPFHNDWHAQIEEVCTYINYAIDWREVSSARDRLWSLYRESSESASQLITSSPISAMKPTYNHPSPTSCNDHGMNGFS